MGGWVGLASPFYGWGQMRPRELRGGSDEGVWGLVSGLGGLCTALGEMGLHSPSSPEDSDFSLACQSC